MNILMNLEHIPSLRKEFLHVLYHIVDIHKFYSLQLCMVDRDMEMKRFR